MLTLNPGESRELSLPGHEGELVGKPDWSLHPLDLASLVVHDDGRRAVMTAGVAGGRRVTVAATAYYRVADEIVAQHADLSVRIKGERATFGAIQAAPREEQPREAEPPAEEPTPAKRARKAAEKGEAEAAPE